MEWIFAAIAAVIVAGIAIFIINKRKTKELTLETIVGERCTVVETVDNYAGSGLVKVGNQIWAARCVDDSDVFDIGEAVFIVAIEGVRLICKK